MLCRTISGRVASDPEPGRKCVCPYSPSVFRAINKAGRIAAHGFSPKVIWGVWGGDGILG
jgi:hypothetical protein